MPSEKQIDYIAEAIKDSFGDRCHEHSDGCPTCEAWKQYDDLCAAPDVPELVRYDPNNKAYPYFEMEESELGEYVRYDQAAEIIRFMIPRVNNCGRYIAERNDGALMYLNHGNTWQGCDNFIAAKDARIAELEADNKRLRKALEVMLVPYEGSDCRRDHHGYCQEHFLEEDCCVAKARAALGEEKP